MKNKRDMATDTFSTGINCAASVFSAFCEDYGIGQEMARKLACGLGGGCRAGEVCGAVSGAALVVGLKHGQWLGEDKETKALCSDKTAEFIAAFKARQPALTCRDLLGVDVSTITPDERQELFQDKRHICVSAVGDAAAILEELGY